MYQQEFVLNASLNNLQFSDPSNLKLDLELIDLMWRRDYFKHYARFLPDLDTGMSVNSIIWNSFKRHLLIKIIVVDFIFTSVLV